MPLRIVEKHGSPDQSIDIVANICRLKIAQAVREQTCANEKHERQRSLRDYEYWAQTRDRSSWMMRSCSKRRGEIGPCRLQRRCKPCEHTRNNANGERDDGSAQLQAVVEQRHPR